MTYPPVASGMSPYGRAGAALQTVAPLGLVSALGSPIASTCTA
jgi:hypothetical protein